MSALLERFHDDVLTLTLNRPDVHNAFDDGLIGDLNRALDAAKVLENLRAVVITADGPSFSAGADLEWMRRMVNASEHENEQDAMRLADLMRCLNYLPFPTIARVNGHAFGGGVGLIACCDIAVSVDHAHFGLTEARLGLAPAVISPYVYRRIGESHARRYFLTAEHFTASRAQQIGLIHESVPAERLDETVEKLLKSIGATGPRASGLCKNLVFAGAGHDEEAQQQFDLLTTKLIARMRISSEGQEGLKAFLEKRKPRWVNGGHSGN
jgi:methylglutaconyl-CoA hydratase